MNGAVEKVFVSHSSVDKPFVRARILPQVKLAKRDYWYDEENIQAGDLFDEKILTGILDDCQRQLVVISKDALGSDWVKKEVAWATKKIMVKSAKVDLPTAHRKILPVMLDERDKYGTKDLKAQHIDLFMFHPYLTLVNYIKVPHNAELEGQLDRFSKRGAGRTLESYLAEDFQYTSEQQDSVKQYVVERDAALEKVGFALRNPDALRFNFQRYGKAISWLAQPTFQRFALAASLAALLIPMQFAAGTFWQQSVIEKVTNEIHSVQDVKHEIKIDLAPLANEAQSQPSTSAKAGPGRDVRGWTWRNTSRSTLVSLESNESGSGQQENGRTVEIQKIGKPAENDDKTNVWRVQATDQNGNKTAEYFRLVPALITPSLPEFTQVRADGTVVKSFVGEDLSDDLAITSEPDTFLCIGVKGRNENWRVKLNPQGEPPEIEFAIRGKDGKSLADGETVNVDSETTLSFVAKYRNGADIPPQSVTLLPPVIQNGPIPKPEIAIELTGLGSLDQGGFEIDSTTPFSVVARHTDGTTKAQSFMIRPKRSKILVEALVNGTAIGEGESVLIGSATELTLVGNHKNATEPIERKITLNPESVIKFLPSELYLNALIEIYGRPVIVSDHELLLELVQYRETIAYLKKELEACKENCESPPQVVVYKDCPPSVAYPVYLWRTLFVPMERGPIEEGTRGPEIPGPVFADPEIPTRSELDPEAPKGQVPVAFYP